MSAYTASIKCPQPEKGLGKQNEWITRFFVAQITELTGKSSMAILVQVQYKLPINLAWNITDMRFFGCYISLWISKSGKFLL